MTLELFREDGYLREGEATIVAVTEQGVELDRTIFYPLGGGQPGDTGYLTGQNGQQYRVADTRKDRDSGQHIHFLESVDGLNKGDRVSMTLDWDKRHVHMRVHTCLHLLCSLIDAPVTGGNISGNKGRLDFDLPEAPDKESLTEQLNQLIQAQHPVSMRWITDEELDAQPELVRTLSVQPPRGTGRVRLIHVDAVDLQPCGGTHVANTGEIGHVQVTKIENKGKGNRRIILELASD
ncbi:Ala-tRNA(Pro) hydrolase [Hahella sp. CCB-MM4]|uniref:alanyl-tRNA editing protein n=1 Tax=Hahella sp. (strain CCB-MM4) TaxID=1926491 RepID=UPI000B9BC73C|nr:alanyl-tRNA editing protein [Hahella sp. CCB-MM4]OZG72547.1 Ala-tRNA(Pro) hydrolase [Hahella sp. CCB-MM4]